MDVQSSNLSKALGDSKATRRRLGWVAPTLPSSTALSPNSRIVNCVLDTAKTFPPITGLSRMDTPKALTVAS